MTLTALAHERLSKTLLLPLWRAQRYLRPSRRAVALAIRDGLRFRRRAAAWSDERKREWVLERLRLTVLRAYRETTHYRELFRRIGFDPLSDFSFDDFARLPVLERDDLRAAGTRLISRAVPAEQLKKDATGGSTGVPTEVWIGPEEMGWKESCGEFFMKRLGVAAGASTAFFWGHNLDPNGATNLRERYHNFETNSRWFDCLRLSPDVLERYHREFERWRPTCIVAYASALGHLAEHVLERGYKPNYPRCCFVTGAEKLLPQHRSALQAAFNRPVHERYGGRDVGYLAFQMNPDLSLEYEVDWANILIEPETEDESSAILVTKLHADGMPMIRYRVGDLGSFDSGSKPGTPVLTLKDVTGRDVDRIWLPDGRWISGLQIPHMMKDYPVREYMVLQHADFSVEVKIAPKAGFNDSANQDILSTIRLNLPGLKVTSMIVEQVPRTAANKWRPVLSEVNLSKGNAA